MQYDSPTHHVGSEMCHNPIRTESAAYSLKLLYKICIADDFCKQFSKEFKKHQITPKGYISSSLFETLFDNGVHLVTGMKNNMKNRLMSLYDKIMLRKRSVIETINDQLKNICEVEHSRHRAVHNFVMNLISALAAYCFFDKKPAIRFQRGLPTGQIALFA